MDKRWLFRLIFAIIWSLRPPLHLIMCKPIDNWQFNNHNMLASLLNLLNGFEWLGETRVNNLHSSIRLEIYKIEKKIYNCKKQFCSSTFEDYTQLHRNCFPGDTWSLNFEPPWPISVLSVIIYLHCERLKSAHKALK